MKPLQDETMSRWTREAAIRGGDDCEGSGQRLGSARVRRKKEERVRLN